MGVSGGGEKIRLAVINHMENGFWKGLKEDLNIKYYHSEKI
jgi:hypothetical protein